MKIPPQAKKVFTGVLFDVYHWEQEMFDGTKATYEMLKRKSAVDVITIVGNKILIGLQEQPGRPTYPSFPGGKIEESETPLDAAKRELLEETGYTANKWELVGEYNDSGSKIDFPCFVFRANGNKTHEQDLDSGEKITNQLVSFDEFLELAKNPKLPVPPGFRHEMFEALLDENKKTELKQKLGLN